LSDKTTKFYTFVWWWWL